MLNTADVAPLANILITSPTLLLFVVVAAGFLVARVRLARFSLGVAAVLFAGIAASVSDDRFVLPEPGSTGRPAPTGGSRLSYATVYRVAMIGKIVAAQAIVSFTDLSARERAGGISARSWQRSVVDCSLASSHGSVVGGG